MARKRKKGSQKRQNAAGDSRVSVLTEDGDTFNPFKDIKNVNVEVLKKTNKIDNKKKNIKKEPIVEKLDDDVSFADIFQQWEKGGVINAKKANQTPKKEADNEDFAKIFDQWEISQGLKPKYAKKPKDSPNRKVSKYKPTKDFGKLLDQFENGTSLNNKTDKKIKQKNNKKIYSKKELNQNNSIEKEEKVLKNISSHQIKEDDKISDAKKDVAWSANSNYSPKIESVDKKEPSPKSEKDKHGQKNSDNSNLRGKEISDMDIKVQSPKTKSKWDFSDIYGAWESKHSEEEMIEAKKLKEKKESKGISISYLRSMKPQDEIDLHGLTSDIAALKVSEFLVNSRNKGLKKVSIITGKGLHSENGKCVLREVALEEIRFSNIVREAYHPKAIDGGSGVIWVIFKSITDKKIYY
ncbi:MAG: Smr/MutS family protein [Pleomorphochaeta sp.]